MSTVAVKPSPAGKILWAAIAIVGAWCLGVVALRRGEPINAIWLVAAAIAVFVIGYRFYSKFINDKVLRMDPSRATPAVLRNDGLDYVPTDKWVVFGHHFAAIAGAGPLVGHSSKRFLKRLSSSSKLDCFPGRTVSPFWWERLDHSGNVLSWVSFLCWDQSLPPPRTFSSQSRN